MRVPMFIIVFGAGGAVGFLESHRFLGGGWRALPQNPCEIYGPCASETPGSVLIGEGELLRQKWPREISRGTTASQSDPSLTAREARRVRSAEIAPPRRAPLASAALEEREAKK